MPKNKELQSTTVGDFKLQRLDVPSETEPEIRVGWFPDGRFIPRPPHMPEEEWVKLLAQGVKDGTLSPDFLERLKNAVQA